MSEGVPKSAGRQSSRPKARWGDRNARGQDIRAAATAALERDGLSGLSMRAVAEGAQVSVGTVYTYFASKEELYAVLYAERLEQFADEVGPATAGAATVEQALVAIADRYFDVYRVFGRELNVWAVLSGADSALPSRVVVQLAQAAMRVFAEGSLALARLDPGFAALSADRRRLAVQVVWTSFNGLAEHFASVRQLLHAGSRAELTELTAKVLVAGLRAVLTE